MPDHTQSTALRAAARELSWRYHILPPVGKMTPRQRFIYEAGKLFGLSRDGSQVMSLFVSRNPQVEKTFHDAMMTIPLPQSSGASFFVPPEQCREKIFVHLFTRRLSGMPLPLPVEHFKPVQRTGHMPRMIFDPTLT